MPIVKAYTGHISIKGCQNWHTDLFYHRSNVVYGETQGIFFDNFVDVTVTTATDASKWVSLYQPAGYLPADEYWSLYMSAFPQYRGFSDGPFSSFPAVVVAAVRMRDRTILTIAEELAFQGKTTVTKILPPPEKPLEHDSFYEMIYSQDTDVFHEISQYGHTGVQLDEMLRVAELEGYLKPKKRLSLRWEPVTRSRDISFSELVSYFRD